MREGIFPDILRHHLFFVIFFLLLLLLLHDILYFWCRVVCLGQNNYYMWVQGSISSHVSMARTCTHFAIFATWGMACLVGLSKHSSIHQSPANVVFQGASLFWKSSHNTFWRIHLPCQLKINLYTTYILNFYKCITFIVFVHCRKTICKKKGSISWRKSFTL